MRRKKKDKNNINNQEEIDLIPIESQQEETEVGTQPDAEPENPEATAEDTSDASLETETEVESIKTEAESAEPESSEVAAEDTSAQPETPEEESESSALFGAYVAEENKWERKNRIKDEKIKAKQEKKRAKYADVDDDTYEQMKVSELCGKRNILRPAYAGGYDRRYVVTSRMDCHGICIHPAEPFSSLLCRRSKSSFLRNRP